MAKKNTYVEHVRALRTEGVEFEEIQRRLGQQVRDAIEQVRNEETSSGKNKPAEKEPTRKQAPSVPSVVPYAQPQPVGCRAFAEPPELVS